MAMIQRQTCLKWGLEKFFKSTYISNFKLDFSSTIKIDYKQNILSNTRPNTVKSFLMTAVDRQTHLEAERVEQLPHVYQKAE